MKFIEVTVGPQMGVSYETVEFAPDFFTRGDKAHRFELNMDL